MAVSRLLPTLLPIAAGLLLTVTPPISAQVPDQDGAAARSEWRVVPDRPVPTDSTLLLPMPPGWHVTTGPGMIAYDPDVSAGGVFSVATEAFRFAGASAGGYGLFFAGAALEEGSPETEYVAFLVDRDGRFRVYHRGGEELHEIVPWTEHPAITARSPDPAEPNARNVLTATVTADSVSFAVNGETVGSFARPAYFRSSGQVGLRVDEGVEVHFVRLDVEEGA